MSVIDFISATSCVENYLSKPENRVFNDIWVICNDRTVHGEFGWMFFYTTKRFQETGNWRYEAPGNVPIFVDREGKLYLAGSGALIEASIFAFVKNRKDFTLRSLGPFNRFIATVYCQNCGSYKEIAIAAKIGLLSNKEFRVGELAYPANPIDAAVAVGPAPNLEYSDFVSNGLGICPACRYVLWAKIYIQKCIFHSVRVQRQPSDPEAWTQT